MRKFLLREFYPSFMPPNNRANVKNQNNPAFKAALNNRANQLNPNHAPTKSGPKKK